MVPSLVALCIRAIAPYPDQVHSLPVRLRLRTDHARALLDDLVPDPATLDPRLWATIIQVFDALPPSFTAHTLPLADTHLPLLQSIPASSYFSLITLLHLSACTYLTDDTVLQLRSLHTLTAFDASNSSLSSYGVKSLAATLQLNEDIHSPRKHRGPWVLRILSLRNCKQIADDVFPYLDKFPLLSVVDLRGTRCTSTASSPFQSCNTDDLYYPASLNASLTALQSFQPNLLSSSSSYFLNIDTFQPPPKPRPRASAVAPQDAFVVIPSDPARKIKVGNTHVLERQIQEREESLKHERNKEAWYERQERIESRMYDRDYDHDDDEEDVDQRHKTDLRKQVEKDLAGFIASSTHHPQERRVHKPDASSRLQKSSWIGGLPPQPHKATVSLLPARTRVPELAPKRPGPISAHIPTSLNAIQRSTESASASTLSSASRTMRNSEPKLTAPGLMGVGAQLIPLPAHVRPSVPAAVSMAGVRTVAAGTSTTSQFYQRLPQPSSASSARQARASASKANSTRIAPNAQAAADSDDDDDDNDLRLYRHPPTYAFLTEALRRASSGSGSGWDERHGPARANLNEMAVVDMTSKRAERARREMEVVLAERMRAVGGGREQQRGTGSISSKEEDKDKSARRFGRAGTLPASSLSSSLSLSSFSSSFTSSSVLTPIQPSESASRHRNPFRKRVSLPSFPDLPVFEAAGKTPARTMTTAKQPSSIQPSPTPLLNKRSASDGSTVYASSNNTNSKPPTNAASIKPLVPISAVKVPLLPDDVRRELALSREAESVSTTTPRKKMRLLDSDETEEDDAGATSSKPALGRRASSGGADVNASTSRKCTPSSTTKTKTKAGGSGGFDWNGWSKKAG
ncbi:hypothetical protein BDZ97DRAFT_1815023 [Flammula alnicola]|nr:hypothetical protein BDZ97DRAFT_1815023 [Flammula alnicola]